MRSKAQPTPHEELDQFDVRVIVAGSRGFSDYDLFAQVMDNYCLRFGNRRVVYLSGKASSGADALVIRWCQERGFAWAEFPADWDDLTAPGAVVRLNRLGKPYNVRAGFQRNAKMGQVGTDLITFYDGFSNGTRDMMDFMIRKCGKEHVTQVLVDIEREEG